MSFWKTMAGAGIGMVVGGPVGAVIGGVGTHFVSKKIDNAKEEAFIKFKNK